MPQKIKKQVKKSLPLFLAVSLVMSTAISGLFFRIDFDLYRLAAGHLGDSLSFNEAQAQNDLATTTVTVRNAPPAMSGSPIETPSSTSTSPINIGDGISFSVSANDPENNNFYIAVCGTNAVTATNGAAPTCAMGNTLCISGAQASGGAASCTYTVADPGSETKEWYAFVCDNHASEAECSLASQGAAPGVGDNSSPFYVNHAPSLTGVATISDYKNPNNVADRFVVRATTTDTDVLGGADVLTLEVCQANAWATSTGCVGGTLCTGTSTSGSVQCSFATSSPARDGAFTYYAFVKDWHTMRAPGNQNSQYHVNNVAPAVSNIILNDSATIVVNMKGMADKSVTVKSSSVTDENSCLDLVDATTTVFWSSATNGKDCTANNNDCYQAGLTACAIDTSTCTGAGDLDANMTCTTTLAFHAVPTDNSTGNPNNATSWLAAVTVFDEALSSTTVMGTGVDLQTVTALEVSQTGVPYGQVKGGQNSENYNATTTIVNYGNSPLNTDISGTDMTRVDMGVGSITAVNQKYGLSTGNYTALTWNLSNAPVNRNIVAGKPTSAVDVADDLYWGINIPGGTVSGDYAGTNTFTATLDSGGW